jgi:hypothetical protein
VVHFFAFLHLEASAQSDPQTAIEDAPSVNGVTPEPPSDDPVLSSLVSLTRPKVDNAFWKLSDRSGPPSTAPVPHG